MSLLEQEQRNLIDSLELGIMLGYSRDWVLHLCKIGKLPKPVKAIHRNRRWLVSDIERWLSLGRPSQAEFERHRGKIIEEPEYNEDDGPNGCGEEPKHDEDDEPDDWGEELEDDEDDEDDGLDYCG